MTWDRRARVQPFRVLDASYVNTGMLAAIEGGIEQLVKLEVLPESQDSVAVTWLDAAGTFETCGAMLLPLLQCPGVTAFVT